MLLVVAILLFVPMLVLIGVWALNRHRAPVDAPKPAASDPLSIFSWAKD